jgi:putative oxidoreductase
MKSLGLFILRVTVGGLLAGHGAQKLFGWSGGPGFEGTSSWLESMGLRPGRQWAALAALSEFGGGLLTLLGFLNPIGPLLAAGSMLMATRTVHRGKPIWVTSGGAELPLTNMSVLGAVAIMGPGAISVDKLLGIRVRRWILIPGLAAIAAIVFRWSQPSEQPAKAGAPAGRTASKSKSKSSVASGPTGRRSPAKVPVLDPERPAEEQPVLVSSGA